MEKWMMFVPLASVLTLVFAAYLAIKVNRQTAGTDKMKEIAGAIAEGARAFLAAEYKILVVFVAVLFVPVSYTHLDVYKRQQYRSRDYGNC